jgi:23S rRNA (cytosine1962-C5)-methyltransferase
LATEQVSRPVIRLQPGRHKRAGSGYPWVYSNEIVMDAAAKTLAPGTLVRLEASTGQALGVAMFNPRTLIAARLLDRDADTAIDVDFLARKLDAALKLRERLYPGGYYRLIHAEADGLPGLIVDRFGDMLAVQANTAGMDRLQDDLVAALDRILAPETIVFRNDSGSRTLEGLPEEVKVAKGTLDGPSELIESGARYLIDLRAGQKTGWFYDQRENRAQVARVARDARVLDVYSYCGGFAISAARAGARQVIAVDRSQLALDFAQGSARRNGVTDICSFVKAEAFAELERRASLGERFDVVITDPPAFVKSRKDLAAGSRGYRKLARLASALVAPGGFFFIASCSHNVDRATFDDQVAHGLHDAHRTGRLLLSSGAAPDHPVHPALPETAYLKGSLFQID